MSANFMAVDPSLVSPQHHRAMNLIKGIVGINKKESPFLLHLVCLPYPLFKGVLDCLAMTIYIKQSYEQSVNQQSNES